MEAKCHYKLRSSLKRRKSRNPLGSLDISEANPDTTLAPSARRVSFAASNYVKPFLDDPEKNTIWDNTYEEEVNHTDPVQSENTNHINLSEIKSQCQEKLNIDVHKECITNIYCDQDVINMEVSCFDQTIINDELRDTSGESNSETTSCILPNINVMNTTKFFKDEDMSMTCCFKNVESLIIKNDKANVCATEGIAFLPDRSEMEFTCAFPNNILEAVNQVITSNVENKESMPNVNAKKESAFSPDQSDMEFTCAFSNKTLETVNQSPAKALSANVENMETDNAKAQNVFLHDNSDMEFTCAFSTKMETIKQRRTTINSDVEDKENRVTVIAKKENDIFLDQENMPIVNAKKEIALLPDQSDMEFTCAFSNKILETAKQPKGTENVKLVAAISANVENKENIMVYDEEEKICLLNKKEIKSYAFSNLNMEHTLNKLTGMDDNYAVNIANKENLATAYVQNEKVVLADESEMEVFCAFPPKILEKENQSKKMGNNSSSPRNEDVQNKENKLPVNSLVKSPDVHNKIENKILSHQTKVKFICSLTDEISEKANQPKSSNCLATVFVSGYDESKENKLPARGDLCIGNYSKETERSCLLKTNINDFKIESTNTAEALNPLQKVTDKLTDNLDITQTTLKKGEPNNQQCLLTNAICNLNNSNASIKNNSKYISPPKKPLFSIYSNMTPPINPLPGSIYKNLTKPEKTEHRNSEIIKPVKVREFGNIPVAIDLTDISIDQNVSEVPKTASEISRQDYDPKENTYTVSVQPQPEKTFLKLKNNTLIVDNVSKGTIRQNDNVDLQGTGNIHHANDIRTESTDPVNITLHQNIVPIIYKKQNPMIPAFTSNIEPDLSRSNFNEGKKIADNNSVNQIKVPFNEIQNQIKSSIQKEMVDCSVAEECTLLESIEESVLINSITLPDEDLDKPEQRLGVKFLQGETQHEVTEGSEDDKNIVLGQNQLGEKNPATKVIYSEPMKVKPFYDEFPSMQTSCMNPFNFSSIASMEDTQQLIQATFSKQSFIKTDQFENNQWQSGYLPEPNLLENSEFKQVKTDQFENDESHSEFIPAPNLLESSATDMLIKTDDNFQNETLKTESVLKNIRKKLIRGKFEPIRYKEIAASSKEDEICENMEKLLANYRFTETCTYNLQEKNKKISLGNISLDGSSCGSTLEGAEENNCNKSMILESNKSLHEKIVDVCTRSNKFLKIKYFEDCSYIFSTVYECVLIYVEVHSEDGRVTEIKTASSLDDSADILNHFIVKNVLDKLKKCTLKSCLGPYYDVLSLLDHICLTVDEVMEFQYEFLCLQDLYPTLRINSDYSISFEILHISPPIWWKIGLPMVSVNRINNLEALHLESKWGNINEEHIKQILRNIHEGVDSLRTFMSNVLKYFERTQLLRLKVQ